MKSSKNKYEKVSADLKIHDANISEKYDYRISESANLKLNKKAQINDKS